MPNWCQNTLTIRGTSDDIKRFAAENAYKGPVDTDEARGNVDHPLSFEACFPTPEEFRDKPSPPPGRKMIPNELMELLAGTIEPYDWYTWRVVNWGTKWDVGDGTRVDGNPEDGYIRYDFDTAWSPPVPWVLSVSKRYPSIAFYLQYEEGGCSFEGYMKIVNGKTLEEHQGEYSRCQECNERKCDCPPEGRKGKTDDTA
jgi:hypothetical protein